MTRSIDFYQAGGGDDERPIDLVGGDCRSSNSISGWSGSAGRRNPYAATRAAVHRRLSLGFAYGQARGPLPGPESWKSIEVCPEVVGSLEPAR